MDAIGGTFGVEATMVKAGGQVLKGVWRVVAMAVALTLGLFAQVHVERSQDGKLLVTDQNTGGTRVYAEVGSAPVWRHKDGRLEVWEQTRKDWIRAPSDYTQVASSGGLVFGYGPGTSGSAVYDVSRQAWVPQFDRYHCGAAGKARRGPHPTLGASLARKEPDSAASPGNSSGDRARR